MAEKGALRHRKRATNAPQAHSSGLRAVSVLLCPSHIVRVSDQVLTNTHRPRRALPPGVVGATAY